MVHVLYPEEAPAHLRSRQVLACREDHSVQAIHAIWADTQRLCHIASPSLEIVSEKYIIAYIIRTSILCIYRYAPTLLYEVLEVDFLVLTSDTIPYGNFLPSKGSEPFRSRLKEVL